MAAIAPARRFAALLFLGAVSAVILLPTGASVLSAGDGDVDHSCGAAYLLQPGPESPGAERLTLSVQPAPLDFRRSRGKKVLEFEFRSTDPSFFVDASQPLHAMADLYRDGMIYHGTAVPAVTVNQGVALVDVCIDPTAEHLSAGSYNGTLRIVDPRVAYTSVSFAITLQYGLESRLPTWVGFGLLVFVVSVLVSWFVASQAAGGKGRSTQSLTTFLADNRRAPLFGLVPFGLTWSSIYLQDTAWPGDFESFFRLFQACIPAVAGAISAAAIYHSMPATATAGNVGDVKVPSADASPRRGGGRQSRGMGWALLAVGLCVASVLLAIVISRPQSSSSSQQISVPSVTSVAGSAPATSTATTSVDSTTPVSSNPSSVPDQGPSTSVTPTTVPPADGVVDVPNLFGKPADEALPTLQRLGFGVVSYQVCSSSVPAGAVRQILVHSTQTVVLDKKGVLEAGRSLARGTLLEVKLGSGVPCG